MIAMLSLCSSFTVLCYVLSYKGSESPLQCGSSGISRHAPAKHAANESPVQLVVWSDRHGFRGNEVGSLQPNSVPFRGHMNHFVVRNFFAFGHMLDRAGEREGDA